MRKALIFVVVVVLFSFGFSFLIAAITGGAPMAGMASPEFIGLTGGISAGAVYLALSGNRKVALADDAERGRALEGPSGDGAQLLVVREGFYGKAAGVDVLVDGEVRTQLKSPRFAAIALAPGRHEVVASLQKRASLPAIVELAPGETKVVRVHVGMGKPTLTPEYDIAAIRTLLARIPMVAS